MINRIRRSSLGTPKGYGSTVGFQVDEATDQLRLNLDSGADRVVQTGTRGAVAKTAAFAPTAKESGSTYSFDSTTSLVATLPAITTTNLGMKFRFYVLQLVSSGAGHAVSPAAADAISGNGFTVAVNKDAICSAATDRIGDVIEVEAVAANRWLVTEVIGTWDREA